MQARYYDPNIGRFLSMDPVGFLETGSPANFNRYNYAFNDPTNLTDPTGMLPPEGSYRGERFARHSHAHATGIATAFRPYSKAIGIGMISGAAVGGCVFGGCQAAGTVYLANPLLYNGLVIGGARMVGDPGRNPASGASAKVVPLLASPKMNKHHIFNVFRGRSESSQVYRDFFKSHGIKVDDYTVSVTADTHKRLHQAGNNWTTMWKSWIDANPNASTKDVYQQAGKMMDEYGIKDVKIEPYR